MSRDETPGSVRIRTDDGNEWRFDAIQQAANFYDCNRSDAIAFACSDIAQLVAAARRVLERQADAVERQTAALEAIATEMRFQNVAPRRLPNSIVEG